MAGKVVEKEKKLVEEVLFKKTKLDKKNDIHSSSSSDEEALFHDSRTQRHSVGLLVNVSILILSV